jgi:hypothetical protein
MNAILPGRIGAGGHYAPRFGSAANGEGFTSQGWITQFFYRAEEGIQIEVNDFSNRHLSASQMFLGLSASISIDIFSTQ